MPQAHNSFNSTDNTIKNRYGWASFAQMVMIFFIMIALMVAVKWHVFGVDMHHYPFFALLYLACELAILKVLTVTDTQVSIRGTNPFRRPVNVLTTDISDVRLKSGRVMTEVIINLKNGSFINRDIHLTKRERSSLMDSLHSANVAVINTSYKALRQGATTG